MCRREKRDQGEMKMSLKCVVLFYFPSFLWAFSRRWPAVASPIDVTFAAWKIWKLSNFSPFLYTKKLLYIEQKIRWNVHPQKESSLCFGCSSIFLTENWFALGRLQNHRLFWACVQNADLPEYTRFSPHKNEWKMRLLAIENVKNFLLKLHVRRSKSSKTQNS